MYIRYYYLFELRSVLLNPFRSIITDLLEVRIIELQDVVDLHVVVESNFTHHGFQKPPIFQLAK